MRIACIREFAHLRTIFDLSRFSVATRGLGRENGTRKRQKLTVAQNSRFLEASGLRIMCPWVPASRANIQRAWNNVAACGERVRRASLTILMSSPFNYLSSKNETLSGSLRGANFIIMESNIEGAETNGTYQTVCGYFNDSSQYPSHGVTNPAYNSSTD